MRLIEVDGLLERGQDTGSFLIGKADAISTSSQQLTLFSMDSEPMEIDKWDQRFCELAEFICEWSKDPRAKVGAVLYSKRGGDVSIGYNGFPMGVEDSAERLQD